MRVAVREVIVLTETGKPLRILSNDLDAPAQEIADLYKSRWLIELFFRMMKQMLRITRFIGRSENAVRIQIAVALIAFLLLRLLHKITQVKHGLLEFVRLVRANLMHRKDITRLRKSAASPMTLDNWPSTGQIHEPDSRGLVPGIHVFPRASKTWMAGTRPAMTATESRKWPEDLSLDPNALAQRDRYKLLISLVIPRPIALVTTLGPTGVVNAAPFSFFNMFSESPPLCVLGLQCKHDGGLKDTSSHIRDRGAFVVNLVDEALGAQMNTCAIDFPPEIQRDRRRKAHPQAEREGRGAPGSPRRRRRSNAATTPRWN